MISAIAGYALLLGACYGLFRLFSTGRRAKGLPPGPPTIPVLGNIHQMPTTDSHLQLKKWADEYGPVYSLILGTQVMIVLSGNEAVKELLDRRSAIYSDRPDMYIGQTLCSRGLRPLLMRYGPGWRMARKLYHGLLHISVSKTYLPYQNLESKQMLRDILREPESLLKSVQRYSNSLTTQMTYGWRNPDQHDPAMKLLFEVVEEFVTLGNAGLAAFADFFPILRALPEFLLPVKAQARRLYERQSTLYIGHWMGVKKAIAAQTANPCLCVDLARLQKKEQLSEEQAAYMAGTSLEGGSDTTSASLYSFLLAMVLYPDVQRKAQEQIDRVCDDRIPEFEDYEQLSYILCCMKETLRWFPTAVNGAVPHAVTQDDDYMGYKIPKGAYVLNNVWAVERDPTRYPDPDRFEPERFKDDHNTLAETTTSSDVKIRAHFTFGAGRRVCQGMHVAEQSLFLGMSRLLWAFDISPVEGNPPDPTRVSQGFVFMPKPFAASIKPRPGKPESIERIWKDAEALLDGNGQWKEIPKGMEHLKRVDQALATA